MTKNYIYSAWKTMYYGGYPPEAFGKIARTGYCLEFGNYVIYENGHKATIKNNKIFKIYKIQKTYELA